MGGLFPFQYFIDMRELSDVGPWLLEMSAAYETSTLFAEGIFCLGGSVGYPESRVSLVELIEILHLLKMPSG